MCCLHIKYGDKNEKDKNISCNRFIILRATVICFGRVCGFVGRVLSRRRRDDDGDGFARGATRRARRRLDGGRGVFDDASVPFLREKIEAGAERN